MNDKEIEIYKELMELYVKCNLISYGSPDQYQYRHNELIKKLSEFILIPYWKWQNENVKPDM